MRREKERTSARLLVNKHKVPVKDADVTETVCPPKV